MAKAHDIPGLNADLPFHEAAARTVRIRAEELWEQSVDVLDTEDIERVHSMRVATRRLRAVLEIYAPCFEPREFDPVLGEIKALADALGARRDPDVQIEDLDEFRNAMSPADAAGIELFAAQLRHDQAEGNRVLADALEHAERIDLRGRLVALAQSGTKA